MQSNSAKNNKRIAKNTLMLYLRMLFIMLVTLYTSRVVLSALGVVDFGIYNLIGGLTVMFSFFGSSLANATQRFLTYEIGKGNVNHLKTIFNTSSLIFFVLTILMIIGIETIGMWLLNYKLVIPEDRENATFVVFQLSVLSIIFTFNGLVFNSVLIAHENMSAYAYIGIVEAGLKLLIAYFLALCNGDKLIFYASLFLAVTIITQVLYAVLCFIKYKECRYRFTFDKNLLVQMSSFIGWNTFGSSIWVLNQQGINVLLNMFFGPVVNAARGIAFQINNAVTNFTNNFYTAVRPQIVKSYASEDYDYFNSLIFKSSKYSYYLVMVLSMPLILKMDYILKLWLGQVPEHTSIFSRLVLVFSMVDVFTNPLFTAAQATGNLKRYSLIGGLVFALNFPISYVLLRIGCPAYSVMLCFVVVRVAYLFVIIWIDKYLVNMPVAGYMKHVILPSVCVTLSSYFLPVCVCNYFSDNIIGLLSFVVFTVMQSLIYIVMIGMTAHEKRFFYRSILHIMHKNNETD